MTKNITVNRGQCLYVIPESGGYSCLGFQVCAEKTNRLKRELESLPSLGEGLRQEVENMPQLWGNIEAYNQYKRLIDICAIVHSATGYRFKSELSEQLIGLEGKRVEVTELGEKYRFWVGKSTGFIPCHLEIKTTRSYGGAMASKHYDNVRVIR